MLEENGRASKRNPLKIPSDSPKNVVKSLSQILFNRKRRYFVKIPESLTVKCAPWTPRHETQALEDCPTRAGRPTNSMFLILPTRVLTTTYFVP